MYQAVNPVIVSGEQGIFLTGLILARIARERELGRRMGNGKTRRMAVGVALVVGVAVGSLALIGRAAPSQDQAGAGSRPAVVADLYMKVVTVPPVPQG
ncbi:MAG TPA: hypothetical protein VNL71_01835 [Chloroflexota bacterium]|nr:hypothetical protein [Chloroflexota bacterium]